MSAEFLEQLDREAAERRLAAEQRAGEPCRVCQGSGSVTRYVLPYVLGLVECISCGGAGKQQP
jgi:DnaJ-class molecular chaperone